MRVRVITTRSGTEVIVEQPERPSLLRRVGNAAGDALVTVFGQYTYPDAYEEVQRIRAKHRAGR